MSFLKNDLSSWKIHDDIVKQRVAHSCGLIITMILRNLGASRIELIDIELEKYKDTLLAPFISFINDSFLTNKYSENDVLIEEILNFLGNMSNKTQVVPILINANIPQTCLRWLSLSYLTYEKYKSIFTILCNIAYHDDGVLRLRECQCEKIILQFQYEIVETRVDFIIDINKYKQLSFACCMLIHLICDVCELQKKRDITEQLLVAIYSDLKQRELCDFQHITFKRSQLWTVLMKLCAYDDMIDCILGNDKFPRFFSKILEGFLHHTWGIKMNNHSLDSQFHQLWL